MVKALQINMLLCLLLVVNISIQAQDYLINFALLGENGTPDSVLVENQNQSTNITLNGDDVLHLVQNTTAIFDGASDGEALVVYPNPIHTSGTLVFYNAQKENVHVGIYNFQGGLLAQETALLEPGDFSCRLEGLGSGAYVVKVSTAGKARSVVVVSSTAAQTEPSIDFLHSDYVPSGREPKIVNQSPQATIEMQYNDGETLKFTAFLANSTSIEELVPTSSGQIDFNFAPPADGPGEPVTDIDGNTYETVWIGGLNWMAENLKTTKYNDDVSIDLLTDNTAWANNATGAYCWLDNNEAQNAEIYGALYNWIAVQSGMLCPDGWHVPTDAEWTMLEDYIAGGGHSGSEATALKATSGWPSDGNGTDDYGFAALPGDMRFDNGNFSDYDFGYWWTATGYDTDNAWFRGMYGNYSEVYRSQYSKSSGFSVRCVRD